MTSVTAKEASQNIEGLIQQAENTHEPVLINTEHGAACSFLQRTGELFQKQFI